MYLEPKHFKPEEIFPPKVVSQHILGKMPDGRGVINAIWRLMDERVILTIDLLREKFGTMIVNDYLWGGNNCFRGYRPQLSVLDIQELIKSLAEYLPGRNEVLEFKPRWSSFTSQHCYGRAIDCKFKYISAEDVRKEIKRNPSDPAFAFITAIEEKVDWFHFDVRPWDRSNSGILFFNP